MMIRGRNPFQHLLPASVFPPSLLASRVAAVQPRPAIKAARVVPTWEYSSPLRTLIVQAWTKGEARACVKSAIGPDAFNRGLDGTVQLRQVEAVSC